MTLINDWAVELYWSFVIAGVNLSDLSAACGRDTI